MPSAQTLSVSARPRRGDAHRHRNPCRRDRRRRPLTCAVAAAAPRRRASPPRPVSARPQAPSAGAHRCRRCAELRRPRKRALRAIAAMSRADATAGTVHRRTSPPLPRRAIAPVQAREPRHRRHVRGASVETPRKPVLRRPPIPLRRPIPRKLPPHCGNRFRESPSLAAVASLPTVFRIPFCRTTISPITKRTVPIRNTAPRSAAPRNGAPSAPSAPTRQAHTLR